MTSNDYYLIIGDTHGSVPAAQLVVSTAVRLGIKMIIQVGDWAYLWPGQNKSNWLKKELLSNGLTMLFIDGNHDWHERLPRYNSPPLQFMPRGSTYRGESSTTNALFLGGAGSFDQHRRTPGVDWWATEDISDAEVATAVANGIGKRTVLISHEAAMHPPGCEGSRMQPPPYVLASCYASRHQVARVVEEVKPVLHIHGHWHYAYDEMVDGVRTIGLNIADYTGGMIVLDQDFAPVPQSDGKVFVG